MKTQTFKQFQLERLIKEGKVTPASKLAENKEQELKRIREFEAAWTDEERHRLTAILPPKDKLESMPLVLVRERFEEWQNIPT